MSSAGGENNWEDIMLEEYRLSMQFYFQYIIFRGLCSFYHKVYWVILLNNAECSYGEAERDRRIYHLWRGIMFVNQRSMED